MHQQFSDLLTLAKTINSSGGRRVVWTIYHACLDYYAVKVLYTCIDDLDCFPSWLDATLVDLLAIAYKSLYENPQQVYRYTWPLTVALLKMRDPIHRDWLQGQVGKASVLFSNIGLPERSLEKGAAAHTLFLEYNRDSVMDETL